MPPSKCLSHNVLMTSDMCNFTRDKSNLDTRESHRLIPRGACDKGHDRSIYLSAQWVSQAVRGEEERRDGQQKVTGLPP